MINKEDELVIICLSDERRVKGRIKVDNVRQIIYDYVQLGPMYKSLFSLLSQDKATNDDSADERNTILSPKDRKGNNKSREKKALTE